MPNIKNLSAVKKLILLKLKDKTWVSSSDLLEATKQKYFDRRIRELRDEMGYDIETNYINGEAHYRLKSDERKPLKIRSYLNQAQKRQLLSRSSRCALCGKDFSDNKPVIDHRVPLIRSELERELILEDFQVICRECNNQKRSQCRACEFDCQKCYLAFPEQYPKGAILRPQDPTLWKEVVAAASERGLSVEAYIIEIIRAKHEG